MIDKSSIYENTEGYGMKEYIWNTIINKPQILDV